MKCFRLRSYDTSPPGAYPYEEFGEKPRRFPAEPMIEAQAKMLWGYRKGNGLPRATYKESLEDVDHQTCRRLGNDPRFCVECNADDPGGVALAANAPGLSGSCKGCGAPV